MARKKRFHFGSFLQPPAQGPDSPRAHSLGTKRRLVLHLERLEDRFLMNGDPAPLAAVSLAADTDVASQFAVADVGPNNDFALLRYPIYGQPTSPPEASPFNRIADLPGWLVAEADRRHGDLYGKTITSPRLIYWDWQLQGQSLMDVDDRVFVTALSVTDANFSSTNTQVTGVDEADLVETDGDFLYVLSQNELFILDARESGKLTLASRIQLDARPTGMYLAGDRLTLITGGGNHRYSPNLRGNILLGNNWRGNYHPAPSTTEVKVLDVFDRSAPKLVQSTELDGRLISSRMVDGELRIVLQQDARHWTNLLPNLQRYYVGYDETTGTQEYRYETRNAYLGRVHKVLETYVLPSYRTLSVDGQVLAEQHLVSWQDLAESIASRYASATTIATFDTLGNTTGPTATKTLFTRAAAEIYATEDSLYVFGTSANSSYNQTSIWKYDFNTNDHSIELSATGSVNGRLLNQFSADEHEGYLRVVTTGKELFVLQQVGKHLKTVGMVGNLAPGERLHSVRFTGDEAFVVTFRKVDPLFAIDLSDPTNPVVAGELKIPGYSDYLQPIDENHLLGIGRGANAGIGLFQELQVSIFEVGDLSNPQLAHRYSFEGGRSTASIATGGRWTQGDGDHHAVSYFPSAEILAIPVYNADPQGRFWNNADNSPWFGAQESALQVFRVDVQTGFEPLATIQHDSRIMRSLRIGSQLVVVSADQVTVHDLNDPSQTLATLDLRVGSDEGLVELATYFSSQTLAAIQELSATAAEGLADRVAPGLRVTQEFSSESNAWALPRIPVTNNLLAADASFATLGTTTIAETASAMDSRDDPYASMNPEFQQALAEIFADSI